MSVFVVYQKIKTTSFPGRGKTLGTRFVKTGKGGGGSSYMKGTEMLVEKLELKP